MDGTDQISKAPSSRGRWWVKMGSSSHPWAIEAAKQARDRAGLAVNRAKETSSQTGYEGKVADEGQPWGSWMLLLPRALPETRDFWILPSPLGWGTARWDRPRFWLLGFFKQQHWMLCSHPVSQVCSCWQADTKGKKKGICLVWLLFFSPLSLRKLCMYSMHF